MLVSQKLHIIKKAIDLVAFLFYSCSNSYTKMRLLKIVEHKGLIWHF